MKFIIISAVYNISEQLQANIDIKKQDHSDFEVYFGDNLSTDNSYDIIEINIEDDPLFHLIKHKYKLFSMAHIINIANPSDEDVIALVNGGAALADNSVLSYLKGGYEKKIQQTQFSNLTTGC